MKHPLQAIADELGVSLRTIDRGVAELVHAGLIKRQQNQEARPDPWEDAETRLTQLGLVDLGLVGFRPTRVADPHVKTDSEAEGKVPPVGNQGEQPNSPPGEATQPAGVEPRSAKVWIPPGCEALHEAVGTGPMLGLLGLAKRCGVQLQDVMDRAGERVLSAESPVGYLRKLLLAGGVWSRPRKERCQMEGVALVANAGAYRPVDEVLVEPENQAPRTPEGKAQGLALMADFRRRRGLA